MFISWVLIARILGTEGYGQFGIVRSTVVMFSTFAGFSLGITATKYVSEFIHNDKTRTGKIIGLTIIFGSFMGGLVSIIFYCLAPFLSSAALNAPELINELRICSTILFFTSINGAQIGALQGLGAFKTIAIINIIQGVIALPMFIMGAMIAGVQGTVIAFSLNYFIICLASFISLRYESKKKSINIEYLSSLGEAKILLAFSLPAFLTAIMVTPVQWYTDSLLVKHSGFIEMGVFSASLVISNFILMGANMISAPFITLMTRNKDKSSNSILSRFNILAPWALGIFASSPFIIFPEVIEYIFGEQFRSADGFRNTIVIVLLYTNIMMFKQGLGRIMIVHSLQWWSLFSNLLWAAVLILSFVTFSDKTSTNLAISFLIAYSLNTLVVLPLYYRKNIIPKNTIDNLPAIIIWISLIIMAISGVLIESIFVKLIVYIMFSVIVFFSFWTNLNLEK